VKKLFLLLVLLIATGSVLAQESAEAIQEFVFGDLRPDAPELAARGEYGVGVQTLTLTNPDQVDILNVTEEDPEPIYDRTLTVEVWYPAEVEDPTATITYEETLGRVDNPDSLVPFAFNGRAERDAAIMEPDTPFPLIVVSHGYPGSRFMMTYLTENLASKGYVVAAIDHAESTYRDTAAFASTLLNRPLDIRFIIDQMAELGAEDSDSFLAGAVDAENTGLVGYSMGGYGALNVAGGAYGAAYIPTLSQFGFDGVELLEVNTASNPDFAGDERVKAVYAFAPWGMNFNLWDAESLSTLDVPVFFVGGSLDDVAGYEEDPHAIFELATNAERYFLTFENARHNVAPNPAPPEAETYDQFMRYGDNVWDSTRMNNINQHFATAFFDKYLKSEDTDAYLDLIEVAAEGVYSTNDDGTFAEDHTYWLGFPERSAVGLRLEYETGEEAGSE
jgi:predicted dienelactone hydrolase